MKRLSSFKWKNYFTSWIPAPVLFRGLAGMTCVLLLYVFFFVHNAFAADPAENFATDYHISYTISEDGTAHGLLKVTLTNLTSDYYASSYKVQVGFENLVNIQVTDNGGKLVPDVTKTDSGQVLALKFNKNAVGFNNKQVITITFDTPDIAQKQGEIWEINIPGIANQSQFATFDVSVKVPDSFGKPAYVKPAKKDKSLTFTKEDLGKSGISIAFGEKQAYKYSLMYHLQNKNLFPIRTEIALPPSTNYQDVSIDSLSPAPIRVHTDVDGNWLAEYNLSSSQELDVTAKGKIVIGLKPKMVPETANNLKTYLQEKQYWQASHTEIQKLAKELKTPQAIYNYVVQHLSYNFNDNIVDHKRYGAVKILDHKDKAICLEFTDLFIAIARAAGIPAREVDGYAYTHNQRQRPISLIADILHIWPEYYDGDKQTWIMIDPTWGNTNSGVDYFTNLDFDHVTLAKRGVSSTYPIPAGGYKTANDTFQKDVTITFADSIDVSPARLTFEPLVPDKHTAGFAIGGEVLVMNTGPTVSGDDSVLVTSETLSPPTQTVHVGRLLPFEQKKLPFTFTRQPLLTNSTHTITMSLSSNENGSGHIGKTKVASVHVVPVFLEEWRFIGGIGLAILTIIILIIAIKAGRIHLS